MTSANRYPHEGQWGGLWPVLALLLSAVLVPTVCVLWFMTQAMRNERLAVRQKLEEVYRGQLSGVQEQIDAFWRGKLAALSSDSGRTTPPETFASLVEQGHADAVILYGSQGELLYPLLSPIDQATTRPSSQTFDWSWAEHLEFVENDPLKAAEVLADLAARAPDHHLAAQALHAQARCLAKSGQREAALEILTQQIAQPCYHDARDPQGRLLQPNAQLYTLELLGEPKDQTFIQIAAALRERLVDYHPPAMLSAQRLFLMQRLPEFPGQPPFDRLARAEDLALRYVEQRSGLPPAGHLSSSPLDGLWQLVPGTGNTIALYEEKPLLALLAPLIVTNASSADGSVALVQTGTTPGDPAVFMRLPASEFMPDWQLAVRLAGDNPFAAAAEKQITVYLWTGVLVIALLVVLVLAIARYLTRQARLTRLKNDLIATVSHELKTPLASVRVLVDTLIENRCGDEKQTREYLELIARENLRLSRLIDNFLTFSRMERNKRAFEAAEVDPARVVATAVDAVRERYETGGFTLDVQTSPDLPTIVGDFDALVTVLVNLLDNAYKYSADRKQVTLRAAADDRAVRFEVEDTGIGIARRDLKRIFDRFYQVDQRLSRDTGGCGLGLSIVRFIVDAHGGDIEVNSQPGKGSTFIVRLPIPER